MASRKIMTRLQTRNENTTAARHTEDTMKRKAGGQAVMYNKDVTASQSQCQEGTTISLNKSFPPHHYHGGEASSSKFCKRKVTDTSDNPAKQRYALSECGNNSQTAKNTELKSSINKESGKISCEEQKEKEKKATLETRVYRDTPYSMDSSNNSSRGSDTNTTTILSDDDDGDDDNDDNDDDDVMTRAELSSENNSHSFNESKSSTAGINDSNNTTLSCVENGYNNDDTEGMAPIHDDSTGFCYDNSRAGFDSSMDISSPLETVRDRTPQEGGQIDRDTSPLCNIYMDDIMDSLLQKEMEAPLPVHFLETSQEITSRMRGVLMDWLIKVQAHEELEEETLHLCVALIDRYLATKPVELTSLQLLGITSLLIASKFYERFAPEISMLCYLTSDTFGKKEVIQYEMRMLATLEFNLCVPESTTFLRMYLQTHADQQPKEVDALAYYITDLSITSVKLASVIPSVMAASAVYLSRRLVLGIKMAWTSELTAYTRYTPATDLGDTINELARILFKAPQSKYQGARNKFNTQQYSFISYSQITSPEVVDSHFLAQVSTV